MPSRQENIVVRKVPLTTYPSSGKNCVYPEHNLYLELIENKEKVIPSIVNSTYDPNKLTDGPMTNARMKANIGEDILYMDVDQIRQSQKQTPSAPIDKLEELDDFSELDDLPELENVKAIESNLEIDVNDIYDDGGAGDDDDEDGGAGADDDDEDDRKADDIYDDEGADDDDDIMKELGGDDDIYEDDGGDAGSDDVFDDEYNYNSRNSPPPTPVKKPRNSSRSFRKRPRVDPPNRQPQPTARENAPSMEDIKNNTNLGNERKFFRDTNYSTQDEIDEENKKRDILFRFDILKRSYKNVNIPDFNMYSDIKTMENTYQMTVRQVRLDSQVSNYKTYIMAFFMIVEFVLGRFMKFDMEGYSQFQMASMNSYEKLLFELGEKSIEKMKTQMAVEFRLIGLFVVQTVIFLIAKKLMKSTGGDIIGSLSNVLSGGGGGTSESSKPKDGTGSMDGLMGGIASMLSGGGGGGGGGGGIGGLAGMMSGLSGMMGGGGGGGGGGLASMMAGMAGPKGGGGGGGGGRKMRTPDVSDILGTHTKTD